MCSLWSYRWGRCSSRSWGFMNQTPKAVSNCRSKLLTCFICPEMFIPEPPHVSVCEMFIFTQLFFFTPHSLLHSPRGVKSDELKPAAESAFRKSVKTSSVFMCCRWCQVRLQYCHISSVCVCVCVSRCLLEPTDIKSSVWECYHWWLDSNHFP